MMQAVDTIETAPGIYIDDRREIPPPSAPQRGMRLLTKLGLYAAMRAAGVGKAELARRLNCHLPQVDRLLDLGHGSRLEQLEAAFRVLGKRLSVEVVDAA